MEGDERLAGLRKELEDGFAALRKELESDFAAKRLAAARKERRMRDRLEQDRREWEAHKAQERKRLADEAETLRRRQQSAALQARQRTEARVKLEASKHDVEQERDAWAEERGRLEQRVADSERGAARLRRRLWGSAAACAGGAVGVLVVAGSGLGTAALAAGLATVAAGTAWAARA